MEPRTRHSIRSDRKDPKNLSRDLQHLSYNMWKNVKKDFALKDIFKEPEGKRMKNYSVQPLNSANSTRELWKNHMFEQK